MKTKFKKILSMLLVFTMVLGLMSTTAFATTTHQRLNCNGKTETITIAATGDAATFEFEAPATDRYVMYYQVDEYSDWDFVIERTSSSSNALPDAVYRNPHPKERFEGYVLDMDEGDTFALTFKSNGRSACTVTVGVKQPISETEFGNGKLEGFYFNPSMDNHYWSLNQDKTIRVNHADGTLGLVFFTEDLFAYNENLEWTASSSNASVLDLEHVEMVAFDGTKDLAQPTGYAPVFKLNNLGEADITIAATRDDTTVSDTYHVIVGNGQNVGGNDGPDSVTIHSFAELKSEVNNGSQSFRVLRYESDSALTIEETLELPEYIELNLSECELKIPGGVEFTTYGQVYCKNLTVDGTVDARSGFRVDKATVITGTMHVYDSFHAGAVLNVLSGKLNVHTQNVQMEQSSATSIYGMENVDFDGEWMRIDIQYPFTSVEELKAHAEYIGTVGNYIGQSRVVYTMWLPSDQYDSSDTFVIDKDITIPEHVDLELTTAADYVIKKGSTLTNNGTVKVNVPLTVNGTLVNNGEMEVNHLYDSRTGSVTIGSEGTHSGTGDIKVHAPNSMKDVSALLQGVALNDYDVNESMDQDGNRHWELRNMSHLPKLATPKNLEWGVEYREQWGWDEQKQMDVITGFDVLQRPGSMSWETDRPDQAQAEIKVYRVGETDSCLRFDHWFDPQQQPQYRSVDEFMRMELPNGSYYFTVQSIADGMDYRDSDIADSRSYPNGIYTYTGASDKLDVVTNLQWVDRDDRFVRWAVFDENSGSSYIDGYWVQFYFSPTLNGDYEPFNAMGGRGMDIPDVPLENHLLQEMGVGYYKFKVKVLSKDIETIGNSEWSAFSPALDIRDTSMKVNADLNDLINDVHNGTLQNGDIFGAVQQMDTQELQAALAADKGNILAAQNLAILEGMAAGGPARVEVTQDASAFNEDDVAIVGANLNSKSEESSDPIKLVIDKPEKQHVIPERYNSAVAVRFSMTLENVKDPKHLDVPVKITLPVPPSINPDFLVIMHYDVSGGHELIWPYVYIMDGKYYADFVLTSFSDFIMTEIENSGVGEVGTEDGDREERSTSKTPVVTETPLPSYVVSGQWTFVDGKWMFADASGVAYANKWAAVVNPYANTEVGQSAFDWFFFDANGHMMTGWIFDGGRWYYLNPVSDGTQGRMMTGWQLINGLWYYLNPVSDGTKGAMIADAWIDNYYVDANGVWDETKTK